MRRYTPLDPGSEVGIQQLVSLFISQPAKAKGIFEDENVKL